MMDTWVKAGEIKEVTALNYVNLILESIVVVNPGNLVHPSNIQKSPYLKVESGGALFVQSKNGIEAKARPHVSNPFPHYYIDVSNGGIAKFVIIPSP